MTTNTTAETYSINYGPWATPEARQAREASRSHLNTITCKIQDDADDRGWTAAQDKMAEAIAAHKRGEFDEARTLIDQAQTLAFPA
jgi:hypothetical protein